MAFGETVVLAAIMTILATVDIVKAVDENGKEIPITTATTGKLIE